MRSVLLLLSTVLIFIGCSTNNNGTVTVVPIAPTNLTGTVISTSQVNLSWVDNATNEDGYKIERKSGSGSYAVVGSMGVNLTTFSDLGLTPNTTYTYRVYAYNSTGNSLQYSNEVTVTTQDNIPSWLTNGLVAYYPFSGNAGDSSGNGNHGTVNGATLTTDRFGNNDKAYSFDGVNDYIDFGNLDYISTGTPDEYTVSLWINPFSLGNYPTNSMGSLLFGDEISSNNGVLMSLHNQFGFGIYTVGNSGFCNCFPTLNQWINYTITQKSTGIELYTNGNYLGFLSNSINTETSEPTRIGYFYQLQTRAFDGKIDDIRIYNRALSQSEVSYLATH